MPSIAAGGEPRATSRPYAIEREFEDVAAVASDLADEVRTPVDVVGHSYGGRCALGAALLTRDIRRVVSYEGAPTPPGVRYGDAALAAELARLADGGRREAVLEMFMRRVVGMTDAELDRYRADPVWPRRVAAAATIARELGVEASDAAGLDRLAAVRQPVLQVLGSDSRADIRRRDACPRRSSGRRPDRRHRRGETRRAPHPSRTPSSGRSRRSSEPEPVGDMGYSGMPDLGFIEWIVVGFLAGAISGALVGGRTARGCLPNIVVGILGGIVGGWLAEQMGLTPVNGVRSRSSSSRSSDRSSSGSSSTR